MYDLSRHFTPFDFFFDPFTCSQHQLSATKWFGSSAIFSPIAVIFLLRSEKNYILFFLVDGDKFYNMKGSFVKFLNHQLDGLYSYYVYSKFSNYLQTFAVFKEILQQWEYIFHLTDSNFFRVNPHLDLTIDTREIVFWNTIRASNFSFENNRKNNVMFYVIILCWKVIFLTESNRKNYHLQLGFLLPPSVLLVKILLSNVFLVVFFG